MGSAVTLVARNKSARTMEKYWSKAAAFEDQPSMRALNYPPHITFAMCDNTSGTELKRLLGRSCNKVKPARITFANLKMHVGDRVELWAIPENADRLQTLFHAVQSHFDAATIRPEFLPGRWIPHCPLATDIPLERQQSVGRYAEMDIAPFDVVFNAIEVVEYSPIEVIKQWRLDI